MSLLPQQGVNHVSPHGARPAIVKLGGSVIRSSRLQSWLQAISAANAPVVIVPGGGALADEVRQCQNQLGFGDDAAHRMALLAMDQLAWAIAGLEPGFEVGDTEDALRMILRRGHVAVWAPYAAVAERRDVEASWRLTSDSLALWLAAKLGASACYIIKSIAARPGMHSASSLAREGVIDEAFPDMLAACDVPTAIFGRDDQDALAASLSGGEAPAAMALA